MFGADVERIIAEVEAVKVATENAIEKFSYLCAYQMTHYGPHDVALPWNPPCYPIELEYPVGPIIVDIAPTMPPFLTDLGKMNTIQSNMYQSPSQITNCISSPWNELNKMADMFDRCVRFESIYAPYNYLGEKVGIGDLMSAFYTSVCDCKWPMVYYHDWVQRGFDHLINNNSPSITWNDDLNARQTIGQGKQSFSENVNVSPGNKNPY